MYTKELQEFIIEFQLKSVEIRAIENFLEFLQRERLNEETDNYCHCGDKGVYTETNKCGVCGKQNII